MFKVKYDRQIISTHIQTIEVNDFFPTGEWTIDQLFDHIKEYIKDRVKTTVGRSRIAFETDHHGNGVTVINVYTKVIETMDQYISRVQLEEKRYSTIEKRKATMTKNAIDELLANEEAEYELYQQLKEKYEP